MEIRKITPQGFCNGVVRAMMLINKALDNPNTKRPIYMYGGLVHNKHIIEAYKNKGIIIVDDISSIIEGSVIITAHGVSKHIIQQIKEKGLGLINATCFDVLRTHKLVEDKLKEGYTVVFHGKATHPETKGVLGISPEIVLVEKLEDVSSLQISNPKVAFMTQTTMSYFDVIKIGDALTEKYPHTIRFEDICNATKLRQEALIAQVEDVDLCIVVGDPKSNNTNKLRDVCINHTSTPCMMVESIVDLKDFDFSPYSIIGITAGASTPNAIVDEIIEGIQCNDFTSKLDDKDYLMLP